MKPVAESPEDVVCLPTLACGGRGQHFPWEQWRITWNHNNPNCFETSKLCLSNVPNFQMAPAENDGSFGICTIEPCGLKPWPWDTGCVFTELDHSSGTTNESRGEVLRCLLLGFSVSWRQCQKHPLKGTTRRASRAECVLVI